MSTTLALRLPDELAAEIERVAAETQRTKTFLARRAIELYLAEYADYQIALDRLNDKDDPMISSKEFRKRLGR